MTWKNTLAERLVDQAAAAIFAAAVAFAASCLGNVLLGMILAPAAFALASGALGCINPDRTCSLAIFHPEPIQLQPSLPDQLEDEKVVRLFDPGQAAIARPSASAVDRGPEDAGQALSIAFATLKQSLR